jgi:hypothetical protein
MINNIAGYALSIVGAVYIGRLGALPLSASVLANSVYNCTGLSIAIGLSAGMETLCGQVGGGSSSQAAGRPTVQDQLLLLLLLLLHGGFSSVNPAAGYTTGFSSCRQLLKAMLICIVACQYTGSSSLVSSFVQQQPCALRRTASWGCSLWQAATSVVGA